MTSGRLTNEERNTILGGQAASDEFRSALQCLHKFAQVSACPPGMDVVDWFRLKCEDLGYASRKKAFGCCPDVGGENIDSRIHHPHA